MAALALGTVCNRWGSSQMLFVGGVDNTGDFCSGEEVRTGIRFLWVNRVFLLQVHCRLINVYDEDVTRERHVTKWRRDLENGRT